MCGIIAILLADKDKHVNQLLFDGLTVLQHRGQDAAGMVTAKAGRLHLHKDRGLVRDVFQQAHMDSLVGSFGLGHCRYPTAGSSSTSEAQPLYTNTPYGIAVAHNGNLTNTDELAEGLRAKFRHINTLSDSELLLNVFAEELQRRQRPNIRPSQVFEATAEVSCGGRPATDSACFGLHTHVPDSGSTVASCTGGQGACCAAPRLPTSILPYRAAASTSLLPHRLPAPIVARGETQRRSAKPNPWTEAR